MYPRNSATPPRIAIGAVVLIADGTVQSSAVSVVVSGDGGAEGAGGGTLAFSAASNVFYYTPTQAETNFTSFIVVAYKASCLPVSQTIITSASSVAGHAGLDWSKINAPTTAQNLSATNIDADQVVATVTNQLTAAQIATGIFQDTTAGDFTTALSVGKSIMNGVALGTGLTINAYTGNTAQTGDNFARLGAPAGASVSADVAAMKVDTAAILVDTGTTLDGRIPAALVGGRMDANVGAISNDTDAVTRLERVLSGNVTGTVGAASTTTSIVTSAMSPSAAVTDGFKGRIVVFDAATTTANLRGQSTDITASSDAGVLTVTALTTAPVSGDTFTVS